MTGSPHMFLHENERGRVKSGSAKITEQVSVCTNGISRAVGPHAQIERSDEHSIPSWKNKNKKINKTCTDELDRLNESKVLPVIKKLTVDPAYGARAGAPISNEQSEAHARCLDDAARRESQGRINWENMEGCLK